MSRTFAGAGYYAVDLASSISRYPVTFGCWVKPTNFGVNDEILKLSNVTGSSSTQRHELATANTRTVNYKHQTSGTDGTATSQNESWRPTGSYDGTWIMFAGVCVDNTSMTIYAGQLDATLSSNSDLNTLGTWASGETIVQTVIGSDTTDQTTPGGALLDFCSVANVFLYDTNLSGSQMQSLANGTHPKDLLPSNLIGLWFDEHYGGTYTDDNSGNGNHLTLYGTAAADDTDNPGIDAPASGGGGGNVWAPNTGIITDMSGFRGLIR